MGISSDVEKLLPFERLISIKFSFGSRRMEFHKTFTGYIYSNSGRVLDSRPRGPGFEPHRRHCIVVLEQDTLIIA